MPPVTDARSQLLQSVVHVAWLAYGAQAASIAVLDASAREFVFTAMAGEGAGELVGGRFPSDAGIAGTVARTGEVQVVGDVSGDVQFAGDIATETGYVPDAMMVAPLRQGDATVGVLSVLDPAPSGREPEQDRELLEILAGQAALALEDPGPAGRVASRLAGLDDERRRAANDLLEDLERLLG